MRHNRQKSFSPFNPGSAHTHFHTSSTPGTRHPATRRPGDPATRQPGDPATRRPGNPATRQPGNPATRHTLYIMWEKNLKIYDALVEKCPRFERKGKTMPYTSANGHMFSLLNKDGELGFRFSKEVQEKYIVEFKTTIFKSHGAVMKGYVLIPQHMLEDLDALAMYLNESYDYVMSLPSK